MKELISSKKGITLIALVITIVVLIILATVSFSLLLGEDGVITKAIEAKDKMKIAQYSEQIELIKLNQMAEDKGELSLSKLKTVLDSDEYKGWVAATEIITDQGTEKLQLATKEGYMFYITADKVEYKGKGEIKDTSALEKGDVIAFSIVENRQDGKLVKIKNQAEDYYTIEFQLNATDEDKWEEIEDEGTVIVEFGKTLYARLVFGSNKGEIHQMSVADSSPVVVAKDIEGLDSLQRKQDLPFSELFTVTWGSRGTGTIRYNVSGNLLFKNKSLIENTTQKTNISELELGTYRITLVANDGNTEVYDRVTVTINQLAGSTTTNLNDEEIMCRAIYSEYDLAYFRDLINTENNYRNAKIMNNISMTNVCSSTIGEWEPIGYITTDEAKTRWFGATFDGNGKEISNLYVNNTSDRTTGLFGLVGTTGYVKNLTVSGSVKQQYNRAAGGIVGRNEGYMFNCDNKVDVMCRVNSTVGGVCGYNLNTITTCRNNASYVSYDDGYVPFAVGGIVGRLGNDECISDNRQVQAKARVLTSTNNGRVASPSFAGGIVGTATGTGVEINGCTNNGGVYVDTEGAGGICGVFNVTSGTITSCTNKASFANPSNYIGGICGNLVAGTISGCSNTNKLTGAQFVGGIAGCSTGTITNSSNSGEITANTNIAGGICGYIYGGKVELCKNTGKVITKACPASQESTQGTGGIAGRMGAGTIEKCGNRGWIISEEGYFAGGICGFVDSTGVKIDQCYNYDGKIEVKVNAAGGIVGRTDANTMTISNCFNYNQEYIRCNTGNNAGGIVAVISTNPTAPKVANCYNICENITASTVKGSIVGLVNNTKLDITNCYKLNTSALANVGSGTPRTNQVTAKAATYFNQSASTSTSVTYLLNGNSSSGVWGYNSNLGAPYLKNAPSL